MRDEEIEGIILTRLPFSMDDKIFMCSDEGEPIGEPYSYNEWLEMIKDISVVSEDLLGEKE